ncbi:MAG TPA: helix-turn-helix domain-containing protein, partial [bacterium]|nr:helix-turn-helix domain-containing protein [bacterium]
ETNWNQTKAAEKLKLTRRVLRYKIQKYGLLKDERKNTDN